MEFIVVLAVFLLGLKGIFQFLVLLGGKRVLVLVVIVFAFYVIGPAAAVLALL